MHTPQIGRNIKREGKRKAQYDKLFLVEGEMKKREQTGASTQYVEIIYFVPCMAVAC